MGAHLHDQLLRIGQTVHSALQAAGDATTAASLLAEVSQALISLFGPTCTMPSLKQCSYTACLPQKMSPNTAIIHAYAHLMH